jgi:hypothetical protein
MADRVAMRVDALAGEFRCRLYRDNAWRDVTCDDRVPCFAQVECGLW